MVKIKFNSALEMVSWLMNNEGHSLYDNFGREWKYLEYTFYFKDLCDSYIIPGIECLHLFETDLYHII